MTDVVLFASGLLLLSLFLWPRRGHIDVAAARAVLGATRLRPGGPNRWWNADISVATFLPSRRPDYVPVGFLDSMVAALRAGLTPVEALTVASRDLGDAHSNAAKPGWLDPILSTAQAGRPLGKVWHSLARRHRDPDLSTLARAWTISERLGAPLAEAVAAAADMARSRTALTAAIGSATAGAKATSTLLSVLPLGGLGVAAVLGVDPVMLYSHPLAVFSLVSGLSLLLLGRWWVARMIRAAALTS